MNDYQKAAYVFSQSVAAYIELQAMLAANNARARVWHAPDYEEEQIMALITKYGIHHNAVISLFGEQQ